MWAFGIRFALVISLAGLGVACSSSDSKPDNLTCAWLAGDNCWKTTATAASSCLPPATETGMLSADNTTCTFAGGAVVTFAKPLVLPLPESGNATWDFTIANSGQTCLHYQETSGGFSLTVGSQVVTEGLSGPLGVQITCPGGASYSNSNAFNLLGCNSDGGSFAGGLPGNAYSDSATSVSFGLIGTSSTSSNELQLFNCSK